MYMAMRKLGEGWIHRARHVSMQCGARALIIRMLLRRSVWITTKSRALFDKP